MKSYYNHPELRKLDEEYKRALGIKKGKKFDGFPFDINSKSDWCGLCEEKIVPPNRILRYHVQYVPPVVVMACEKCNVAETHLRYQVQIKKRQLQRFGMHRYLRILELAKVSNMNYLNKWMDRRRGGLGIMTIDQQTMI